jgi:uncharacterized protein (TIGR00369 family)
MNARTAAEAGLRMSGLDYLRAMMAGELPPPPIAVTLGIWPLRADEGVAEFSLDPEERHYNPLGVVHGGAISTLLDSVLGCAVQTTLPAGVTYTTLELKVNFVRAVTEATGRLVATGEVVHRGGRVATAEARVVAEATGKLVAHGTATCLILDGLLG